MSYFTARVQKGYILLLALIFLIILTGLAMTQVSLNSTETRIAANATDAEISFEKAEGALNEAINNLLSGRYAARHFLQNSNGLYQFDPTAAPLWTTVDWTNADAVINSFQGNTSTRASYIVEQLPSVTRPGQNMKSLTYIYRITARATGSRSNTAVLLQSTLQIQE